ncbi:hypothetical protein [Silvanigrella aquatica]|uniref:Uncharacterized protein n=1 Tax=Silvanigrella aquatica TaxID=1915309 RepID=A0A1L4CZ64_9BACT|nr:hypothetical protein [Silvanigrella aquatica]APJ03253.1 hypothetical protein AXG55_04785 [Silvanigrella aquatica]
MAFTIAPNDILWTRNGDPVRIAERNDKNGKIILDSDFDNIQETAKFGIRNGLEPNQKEAYLTTLSNQDNQDDRQQEIRDLYNQITKMKHANADPRVIKYLENELQYRIVREKFTPENFEVDPLTLGV